MQQADCDKNYYSGGPGYIVANSTFINNHAEHSAVDFMCIEGILTNCIFINNTVQENGVVYWHWYSEDGVLTDCTFIGNDGRAIDWEGKNGLIKNSYFDPAYNAIKCLNDTVIIRLNSNIDCDNVSFNYGEKNNFISYLKDGDGNVLTNKEIIFQVNMNSVILSYSSFTDEMGIATLPIELTKHSGNFTVLILFEGDGNYNPSQNKFNLNIRPSDSQILINDLNGSVDYNLIISAYINSSNNITIDEGYVVFFDGFTQIGETNVTNGVAALNYTPSTAGTHQITAMFYAENYEDNINSASLNVSKTNVELSIGNIDAVYFSNPSAFNVNVYSNSKGVNEGNIKYYVNGNYFGMSNVYGGQTSTGYVTNTTGSFELLVVYNETDNYYAKNASTIFYVNKMPTKLSGQTTFFDEEQSKIFTVNLEDVDGNGINNQTVKIEVIKYSGESRTFTGISDENGIITFDVSELAGGM